MAESAFPTPDTTPLGIGRGRRFEQRTLQPGAAISPMSVFRQEGETMGLTGKDLVDFVQTCADRTLHEREHQAELALRERELMLRQTPVQAEGGGRVVERVRLDMPFFEDKDNIDSYLCQFERLARLQGWSQETWAVRLGTLLKGKAREVYTGLSEQEASRYDDLKAALLLKFEVSADSYRVQFWQARKESGDSYRRHVSNLQR